MVVVFDLMLLCDVCEFGVAGSVDLLVSLWFALWFDCLVVVFIMCGCVLLFAL